MEKSRTHLSACAYIASSHQPPRQQVDIIHQFRRIASYCANSLHVLSMTAVEHATGGDTRQRDSLLERIFSPEHPFDQLIVTSMTKLSKEPATLEKIEKALRNARIEVIALDQASSKVPEPIVIERL